MVVHGTVDILNIAIYLWMDSVRLFADVQKDEYVEINSFSM